MLIDHALLDEVLAALDASTLGTIHALFHSQSILLAETAMDATATAEARAEAAHALKGLALQLGLDDLCACLHGIETASQQGGIDAAAAGLAPLLAESTAALDRYLAATAAR